MIRAVTSGGAPARGAGRSVTSRALALLGAFDAAHPALTLTELARRSGAPLATAHRLLAELVAWGALDRREDGAYEVGARLWQLGLLAPRQGGLRAVAAPVLHDLFLATRQTVHLAVRADLEVLYVDRVSASVSVPTISDVGARLPLHTTAVGKVLLAWAPAPVVAAVLADLRPATPASVVDPELLARQLAEVRRRGYALTAEEMVPGSASVAVPVTGPVPGTGTGVLAAVGVVLDSSRRDAPRLVPALRVTARAITRGLGRSSDAVGA